VTATGAPEAAARRILIVDDSAIVRHTVAHMLRRLGFVPIEAADGEQALVKIRRSPPDAVILDIHMPVKDGLTTLAELRAAPPLRLSAGLHPSRPPPVAITCAGPPHFGSADTWSKPS
jgi:CheY-like chemotaxis protein